jgi:hypothetical protein
MLREGRRSLMAMNCSVCESDDLAPGAIQSTGKIYFRPKNAKFFSLKTANIEVTAALCLACGHVDLAADTEKARALLDRL